MTKLEKFTTLMLGTLSSVSLVSPSTVRAQNSTFPNPEPCTGNCSWIHDPSIIKRSDGTFFRFSTNGNIAIASAPAISGPWQYVGAMLPTGSVINVTDNQEIWAPDVFFLDDVYLTYYAVSKSGLQTSRIGLATSDTLKPGSWTDHGELDIPPSPDYNLIDPNIFREAPDSPIQFIFGSAWKGIYQTGLNDNGTAQASGASQVNIISNTTSNQQSWKVASNSGGSSRTVHGGITSSSPRERAAMNPPNLAAPGDEYKILVCRSDETTGPFTDKDGTDCLTENGGSLVLGSHDNVYAPGGQGVIYDAATMDLPVVYYHYVDPDVGYAYEDFLMGWNYLDFESGWPEVVVGSQEIGQTRQ